MIDLPDNGQSRRILCLGMPVRDMLFRVGEVPARGSKIQSTQFDELAGGNAPNAAVAIARLGGVVRLSGPMGDAKEPGVECIFDQLGREGIDMGHIVRMPGTVTPISTILIDATGERTGITYRDPRLWTVVLPETDDLLDGIDAILTENRCAEFVTEVCEEARDRGIPVVVDADRSMTPGDRLLKISSHTIFSAEALRATAGVNDLGEALARLSGLTSAFLAVTNGDQGAIWLDAHRVARHTPAFPVRAVDTLGAGDVFHGAFTLAIAESMDIPAALRFAAAAAALKCSRFGGPFGAPQRSEVDAILARVQT